MISITEFGYHDLFPSNPFGQICLRAYDVIWNSQSRDEPEDDLLQQEHKKAVNFYDYVRARTGKQVLLLDLMAELALNVDEVYALFLVIYTKQGSKSIAIFEQSTDTTSAKYLIYEGDSYTQIASL